MSFQEPQNVTDVPLQIANMTYFRHKLRVENCGDSTVYLLVDTDGGVVSDTFKDVALPAGAHYETPPYTTGIATVACAAGETSLLTVSKNFREDA